MRIAVALSGGVDSSIAAFELKNKGHDLAGITIKTWADMDCNNTVQKKQDKIESKMCSAEDTVKYARDTAERLEIPYYIVDLSKKFTEEIEKYFINEYVNGKTPNPCIYCNSRIKFGYLLDEARKKGFTRVATGHYARIINKDGNFYLTEAKDKRYDQSYFLFNIPKEVLSVIEFPVGEMTKKEVYETALKNNFMSVKRKSSQDICFTDGDGSYKEYLIRNKIRKAFLPGKIIDTSGNVVGEHKGIAFYTIGQRRGIGLARENPIYVLEIDSRKNIIIVGEKSFAMKKKIRVSRINWLMPGSFDKNFEFLVRIRYNGKKEKAMVEPYGNNECIITFDNKQFAPAPGQAAVFYDGEIVAGGGWIEEVIA
ncbi:MAG: tRNA 2-thiouridine(34) synthase MnmA [Candidatus Omnitrophota bacterium]